MGPATVIVMFYTVLLTITGCVVFNRWRKAKGSVGESISAAVVSVLGAALIILFSYACAVTMYTNSWDIGWVQ